MTEQEKQIAEKDYLSIVEKCSDKLNSKEDSGQVCDAFMGYYIKQCDALDNLLSYCDIDLSDSVLNPIRDYDFNRYSQQGCIKQNKTITDMVLCEDYLNIPGGNESRYLLIETTKPHLTIPSSTLYTTEYSSEIFGEAFNNYSYPIDSARIFARINDSTGEAVDFHHVYTQDSYLKPGQRSGFWIFFQTPIPNNSNYSLTSEFRKSNTSLPEKLQLTVTNPGNPASNPNSLEISNATKTNDQTPKNSLINISNREGIQPSGLTNNATQSAMDQAREILANISIPEENDSNATNTAMSEANNLINLASKAASNATQTAMDQVRGILNVSIPTSVQSPIDFEISGNVTNLGNVTATNVQVTAIFYDASGKVVDVNTDYLNIGSGLLPGKSQSFTVQPILNYENRDKIVKYVLNAESSEFTMNAK